MPKYKHPRMTEWKEKGYMQFMNKAEFAQHYETVKTLRDKALLTILYFTGARPKEILQLTRADITWISTSAVQVKLLTAKRKDKHIRIIDLPYKDKHVKALWEFCKDMPDAFYVFGWLRANKDPRGYIKSHLGFPAYFFRHNILSLLAAKGASRELIKAFKGAKDMRSVEPYIHLSSKERAQMTALVLRAIK